MSCMTLAPNMDENNKSLTYPKILEINVKAEKPKEDFQKFEIFNYLFSDSKSIDIEFTQYLRPVFSTGPSSKTCPK